MKSHFEDIIRDLMSHDVGQIYKEQGWQDGMYPAQYGEADGLHRGDAFIERVCRDIVPGYENFYLRIYVLNVGIGGICIAATQSNNHNKHNYQIFTLGEDDGWFYGPEYQRIRTLYCSNKYDFIEMVSRGISLLNNINV